MPERIVVTESDDENTLRSERSLRTSRRKRKLNFSDTISRAKRSNVDVKSPYQVIEVSCVTPTKDAIVDESKTAQKETDNEKPKKKQIRPMKFTKKSSETIDEWIPSNRLVEFIGGFKQTNLNWLRKHTGSSVEVVKKHQGIETTRKIRLVGSSKSIGVASKLIYEFRNSAVNEVPWICQVSITEKKTSSSHDLPSSSDASQPSQYTLTESVDEKTTNKKGTSSKRLLSVEEWIPSDRFHEFMGCYQQSNLNYLRRLTGSRIIVLKKESEKDVIRRLQISGNESSIQKVSKLINEFRKSKKNGVPWVLKSSAPKVNTASLLETDSTNNKKNDQTSYKDSSFSQAKSYIQDWIPSKRVKEFCGQKHKTLNLLKRKTGAIITMNRNQAVTDKKLKLHIFGSSKVVEHTIKLIKEFRCSKTGKVPWILECPTKQSQQPFQTIEPDKPSEPAKSDLQLSTESIPDLRISTESKPDLQTSTKTQQDLQRSNEKKPEYATSLVIPASRYNEFIGEEGQHLHWVRKHTSAKIELSLQPNDMKKNFHAISIVGRGADNVAKLVKGFCSLEQSSSSENWIRRVIGESHLSDHYSEESKRESLFVFLATNEDCLKCSHKKFYDWLISQDVASIEDLIEAFGIEEFVQSGMQRTGLKVSNLTNCLSCML